MIHKDKVKIVKIKNPDFGFVWGYKQAITIKTTNKQIKYNYQLNYNIRNTSRISIMFAGKLRKLQNRSATF